MDIIKDLFIEITTNKIENVIIQQNTKMQKPLKKKDFKIDSYQEDILEHLRKSEEDTNGILEKFNKEEIDKLPDKLSGNSSNNCKNCFIWSYSHINDIRNKTLNYSPKIKEYVIKLYDDKNAISKYKNVSELLKYEANSIYTTFKDEIKGYIDEIKRLYS